MKYKEPEQIVKWRRLKEARNLASKEFINYEESMQEVDPPENFRSAVRSDITKDALFWHRSKMDPPRRDYWTWLIIFPGDGHGRFSCHDGCNYYIEENQDENQGGCWFVGM